MDRTEASEGGNMTIIDAITTVLTDAQTVLRVGIPYGISS